MSTKQNSVNSAARADQEPLAGELPQMKVVRSVRKWIAGGTLLPGDPLPSERALASQLDVARGTVRRALKLLDTEGVIRLRPGTRPVVEDFSQKSAPLLETIAAIVLPYDPQGPHQQPGWLNMISVGIQNAVRDAGLHLLTINPGRLDLKEVERLAANKPFGVVAALPIGNAVDREDVQTALDKASVPGVYYTDAPSAEFDCVRSDHQAGSRMLTQWLLKRKRRRIAMVSPAQFLEQPWGRARRASYEETMREAGLEPLPHIPIAGWEDAQSSWTRAEFEEHFRTKVRLAGAYLIEAMSASEPIDAIMCGSDGEVPVVAAACRLFGRKPNEDIDIVGYDNYWGDVPEQNFESSPPLATVDKRNEEIGFQLIKLLLDRINGRLPDEPQCRIVQPELVVKQ